MTIRDTLTRAIRMTGARPLGDTPSSEEMDVALVAFQNMALSLLPATHMTDVLITANYTAGENERITPDGGTFTVTRPDTVTDTLTGDERAPRNGALIEVCGTPMKYIYVSELATWKALTGLTLDSDQPFGPSHDEGVAAMTAVRIAPDLQVPNVPQWVVAMAEQGRRLIRQKFRQTFIPTTDPLLLSWRQRCGYTL